MEKSESEEYLKLKGKILQTGEVGMLCYYNDLADKLEKEGKITLEEAFDIHMIYSLRR